MQVYMCGEGETGALQLSTRLDNHPYDNLALSGPCLCGQEEEERERR